MARLDRQMFEDLSERTGFQIDVLEKVYRLAELLGEIVEVGIGDQLTLKGGTAVNFLYLDLPRLSVDIDLDYIGSVEKEQMKKDREEIDDVLNRLFRTLNYKPQKGRPMPFKNTTYSIRTRPKIETESNLR